MHRLVIGVILLLLAIPPTLAQETDADVWSAYLFNNGTQRLIAVDAAGTVTELPLTFPEETFIGAYDLRFSPDGSLVAYCEMNFSASQGSGLVPSTLTLREVATGATRYQQDMGLTQLCQVEAFSADNAHMVVALDYSPPGTPGRQPDAPAWELQILNTTDGAQSAQIDANSGLIDPGTVEGMVTPIVHTVTAERITFALLGFFDTDPAFAYDWTFTTGDISPNPNAQNIPYIELAATGEIAYLDYDDDFPAPSFGNAMLPPVNALMIGVPGEEPYISVFSPEWMMNDLVFVNGGAAIAVYELGEIDANTGALQTRWRLLGRDGAGISEIVPPNFNITQVADAPGGYVVLEAESDTLEFTLEGTATVTTTLARWQDGTSTLLWEDISEDISVGWELVWSAPVAAPANLPRFSGAG